MEQVIESSENLIAEELAKAGTDPGLIEKLKKDRITVDKELPPMEFLLRLFDVPCCPRGELVAFTGKAKSGKTFVTSMMMAAASASEVLAFHRATFEPLQVLWFDTEQSDQSTQDILRNRIVPLVCHPAPGPSPTMGGESFPESMYDIFNVRTESWTERLPLLMAAIDLCHPDLVILDGVRDLVDDINNGQLAHDVTERLMQVAQHARCCIVCVIHQNKAAEDRTLRGSIGTELTNKAFEVYECEKLPSRTFVLTQKLTRKYDITESLYFTVDDHGLPRQVGAPQQNGQKATLTEDDIRKIFIDTLKNGEMLSYKELQKRISESSPLKQLQQYYEAFSVVLHSGLIEKGKDFNGHVVYKLADPSFF